MEPELELESIDGRHLEFLRQLKNAHRRRFFHQATITPSEQIKWYEGYCSRPDDWMFIIRYKNADPACVGYRVASGCVDLYNLIRTGSADRRSTSTACAFDILCNFVAAATGLPIRGRVLVSNPMLSWFQKRGFVVIGEGVEEGLPFRGIEQDQARRVPYEVTVETLAAAGAER